MTGVREEVDVVVVGAGIAGLATAVALHRVGLRNVVVLERSPHLRAAGAAITLFPNAWRALAVLGVAHKLTPLYTPFHKIHVTNLESGVAQDVSLKPARQEIAVRTVHRSVLLEAMSKELPLGTIRFSSRIASISAQTLEDSTPIAVLHMEDGSSIAAKILIGCDGVGSVVARWLGLSAPLISGRSAVRALSVYPEGHGFDYEVQQFVSPGRRAGYVPLNDKELFWFITLDSTPREEKTIAEGRGDPRLLLDHVKENMTKGLPAKFLDVVQQTDYSTLSWAPLLFRRPWDVILGQTSKANVTVAGDAMHPMTPDLGQGGCSSLEDAVVLGRCIGECLCLDGNIRPGRIVEGGIDKYVRERRWRVARLIAGAYVSGWLQEGGSGWWAWAVKMVRDKVFYRFLFKKILDVVDYDCGDLPMPLMAHRQ